MQKHEAGLIGDQDIFSEHFTIGTQVVNTSNSITLNKSEMSCS
ncbi:hypothetical protein [Vibrio paucivorans]